MWKLTIKKITKVMALMLVAAQLSGCAGLFVAGAATGVVMANDRRSVGTQLDDHSIEFKVNSKLNKDEALDNQAHIRVISMNQRVLLVGQAPNQMLRDRAIRLANEVREVTQVHDQIRISSPTGFKSRTNDQWITTKVKSRMFGNDELDALKIKVVTENSEVFLLGLVEKHEADKAVDIARNTKGVRKVVKVFEYL